MIRRLSLLASVIAIIVASVQPASALDSKRAHGWSVAKVPTGEYSEIFSASCPTASVCWGVESEAVLHSSDGGKSWQEIHPSDLSGDSFSDISCPTSKDCWAIGGQSDATPGDSSLFHTSDGGTKWHATDTEKAYGIGYATAMECIDSSHCWAAGLATPRGTPAVVGTTDGGGHWKKYDLKGSGSVASISCTDSKHCWALGSLDYRMTVKKNGAEAWSRMSSKALTNNYFLSVSCPTSGKCLAIGSNAHNKPVVAATSDGGSKWQARTVPKDMNLVKQVLCISSKQCFAIGDFQTMRSANNYEDAYVEASSNFGSSWSVQKKAGATSYKDDHLLDSISCANASVCVATGANATDAAYALFTRSGG